MDHMEEQELEAEALSAIFDTAFEIISTSPTKWNIKLFPIDTEDEEESNEVNHVGCNLIVDLPSDYPEVLPILDVTSIRGLGPEQMETLLTLANEEAEQYTGMPAIYSVCEAMREWLAGNNVKGLDDQSMHAQMMRRAREEELKKEQAQQKFESQAIKDEMSQAEVEEIAVRKRREEGTPCNKENFEAWNERFIEEMKEKRIQEALEEADKEKLSKKGGIKKRSEEEEIAGRLTGAQQFNQKLGLVNLNALEDAADEAAAEDGIDVDDLDVDEDLFDEDDDLDDLDFDSDDELDSDDEEEDLDI